jgi:RNA polymerase I-specific transcription initiation factor RRN7
MMILQIICRDLWALHLSLLPSPPPPEPLLHQQATQLHAAEDASEEIGTRGEKASPDLSDASSPQGNDIEDNADIDELLRELSESSSSEDDKDDNLGQPRFKPEASGRKLKAFSRNGPASNIALLMVACWTLRLPIMYLDLIRLDCRTESSRLADT